MEVLPQGGCRRPGGISFPAPMEGRHTFAGTSNATLRSFPHGGATLPTSSSSLQTANSPLLTGLLSPDPDKRHATLNSLTRQLSTNDVAELLAFLESHPGDYAGLRPITFNAIKNDVLDVLLRQDKPVIGLGGKLVDMLRDPQQDETWRDYCVQYLAPYYTTVYPAQNEAPMNCNAFVTDEVFTQGGGRRPGGLSSPAPMDGNAFAGTSNATLSGSPPPASNSSLPTANCPLPADLVPEQTKILTAYWEAVASTSKTVAGTALLGLERLSRQYPEFDRERVAKAVVTLANDEATGEPTRITTLRLCGMMKRPEALETVRIAAQTGTTVPLRMAAIAALGELGGKEDMEYLQAVATAETPRLKPVIEKAVKAIQARQGLNKG